MCASYLAKPRPVVYISTYQKFCHCFCIRAHVRDFIWLLLLGHSCSNDRISPPPLVDRFRSGVSIFSQVLKRWWNAAFFLFSMARIYFHYFPSLVSHKRQRFSQRLSPRHRSQVISITATKYLRTGQPPLEGKACK